MWSTAAAEEWKRVFFSLVDHYSTDQPIHKHLVDCVTTSRDKLLKIWLEPGVIVSWLIAEIILICHGQLLRNPTSPKLLRLFLLVRRKILKMKRVRFSGFVWRVKNSKCDSAWPHVYISIFIGSIGSCRRPLLPHKFSAKCTRGVTRNHRFSKLPYSAVWIAKERKQSQSKNDNREGGQRAHLQNPVVERISLPGRRLIADWTCARLSEWGGGVREIYWQAFDFGCLSKIRPYV